MRINGWQQNTNHGGGDWFGNTRWSIIISTGSNDSKLAQAALESLCQIYWKPVYEFVRRNCRSSEDAEELTQEFFYRLIRDNWLDRVDQQKGRFRAFLLTCVKHFLSNERARGHAIKRGGNFSFISLDEAWIQNQCAEEADTLTPEKAFDQRWALTLLEGALEQLKQEFTKAGKRTQFEQVQEFLAGGRQNSSSYQEVATRLGMSEAALRQAAYRMRSRLGEILRNHVAQTVANAAETKEELDFLMSAVGR
jgi:RNA polymerase sigma-70 factor (ECF subfamily)